MADKVSLRIAYGETLAELGAKNDKIVVLDADLSPATMTSIFKDKYPDRFYDFGIAECNMMCAAAGMAHSGLMPFCSTFAMFGAAHAFEQIRNSIAYVGANVKIVVTHAGLSVGEDGGSHQTIEDIALMRMIPGMTIFVPCDAIETKKAVSAAAEIDGPVFIRVARPAMEVITRDDTPFIPGKATVLREGNDVAIFATGLMVKEALAAAEILSGSGVGASVIDCHTIKPFDNACAVEMAKKCKKIITVEEHSVIGGLAGAVSEATAGCGVFGFAKIGVQDRFGKSGKPEDLFAEYGLTAENIVEQYNRL